MAFFTKIRAWSGEFFLESDGAVLVRVAFSEPEGFTESGENCPGLRIARAQFAEYFAGTRKQFDLPIASAGTFFSGESLGGFAGDSLWRNADLRRDCCGNRISARVPSRRRGKSCQPASDCRAVPPRCRGSRKTFRLRGRHGNETRFAGTRAAFFPLRRVSFFGKQSLLEWWFFLLSVCSYLDSVSGWG